MLGLIIIMMQILLYNIVKSKSTNNDVYDINEICIPNINFKVYFK